MLGHKFPNPDLVLYTFHVSVGIRFVYNFLYFLRFFIAYTYFFVTASQGSDVIIIVIIIIIIITGHTWGVQEKTRELTSCGFFLHFNIILSLNENKICERLEMTGS